MSEIFETSPRLWWFRGAKAFEQVNLDVKPTVTVRCSNQGCGRALGYIYATKPGPLWVPLKLGEGARDAVNQHRGDRDPTAVPRRGPSDKEQFSLEIGVAHCLTQRPRSWISLR